MNVTNWWASAFNCYRLFCMWEMGKDLLRNCHPLYLNQTALIKRCEDQIAIKEKTMSLRKCPPCAPLARPIKPPTAKPVKSQNWRLLRMPNIPKDMSAKPTAECPLTNEQFVWQYWLGTKTGTNAVGPAKACTSRGRGRPIPSFKTVCTKSQMPRTTTKTTEVARRQLLL